MRHFLTLEGLAREDILSIFDTASRLKSALRQGTRQPLLQGKVLGLIFEKQSLRTRVSFETAMAQLGGSSLFFAGKDVGFNDGRECLGDFARTLNEYLDAIVLRTFRHEDIENYAAQSTIPVINGLSNFDHPCQALADLFTIQEVFGDVAGKTVAFIGDGNNVARSLAMCCGKLGVKFVLASPEGFGFDKDYLDWYHRVLPQSDITLNGHPGEAVRQADVVYTDVWTSMGQEQERTQRQQSFAGFQVNQQLLQLAPAHARVMHCLPAHRGEEVTDDVLDGSRSVVFQQAGNRLHLQKALLVWLLKS